MENLEMNIYQKLLTARMLLHDKKIEKSGVNKFAGYDYYELSDFIKPLVEIMSTLKMVSVISFSPEQATMTLINAEHPEEQIIITSPMAKAELKGCHDIQNLGAVETYQRRYLYIAAFDIAEPDALDGLSGKEPKPTAKAEKRQEPANKQNLSCAVCGTNITAAAATFSQKKFGKALCLQCQQKENVNAK